MILSIIETKKLTKRFKNFTPVQDVTLRYEYLLERGREEGYGEWDVL